ncbi:uncharacterized protein LOC133910514 [Phragmites australis]|uniref:uncharacterized protein LOC133910514 n=1 Tax=Phragmites australis TaxID=29695 RepID=UPI002D77667C|nr:uncharacterized protein LOC133910514 [Phragmites australis]
MACARRAGGRRGGGRNGLGGRAAAAAGGRVLWPWGRNEDSPRSSEWWEPTAEPESCRLGQGLWTRARGARVFHPKPTTVLPPHQSRRSLAAGEDGVQHREAPWPPHHRPPPADAAADYEDDDEEYEEEAEVTLGVLKKQKRPGLLLRHLFPGKAGGTLAWLDLINLPSGKSNCCGFCGEPLQFVLQIYAPIEDNAAAFHRTLFVFMCPSMSCFFRDQHEQWKHKHGNPCRSVKVFRCQLPRTNAFYLAEHPRLNGSDKPLCQGAPVCHWCGTWKGDKICSSCKKARYCSEKHQAYFNLYHPLIGLPASTSWPEFEIEIDYEGNFDSDSFNENDSKSLVMQRHGKPDAMMQSWMDQFEADADNKCWASFESTRACAEIMPQLLYYFGVGNKPDSLDWATIVVYTCRGSCDQRVSYKEEFAWVQLYPTTTMRP